MFYNIQILKIKLSMVKELDQIKITNKFRLTFSFATLSFSSSSSTRCILWSSSLAWASTCCLSKLNSALNAVKQYAKKKSYDVNTTANCKYASNYAFNSDVKYLNSPTVCFSSMISSWDALTTSSKAPACMHAQRIHWRVFKMQSTMGTSFIKN